VVGRAKMTTITEYCESEYRRLKKTTSLLELALWKINLDKSRKNHDIMCGGNKKLTDTPKENSVKTSVCTLTVFTYLFQGVDTPVQCIYILLQR
jgi:hypothetical protein